MADSSKTPVLRKCVGCKQMQPKAKVIRIVVNQAGEANIDVTKKSPGRGAYICQNHDCLEKAKKAKGIERSLKRQVSAKLYESLTNYISEILK